MPNEKTFYQMEARESIETLNTREEGLSSTEAKQRLQKYGKNQLQAKIRIPMWMVFLAQFKELLIFILILGGLISFFIGNYRDGSIIFIIVLVNAIIGFLHERKAGKIIDKLKNLIKSPAKVMRDGKLTEINQENLVPGDIVQIEAGDKLPADLRLFTINGLKTNDFALTGESVPQEKKLEAIEGEVVLGDRVNMAYAGTAVADGSGTGVVVATGMQTETGKIAGMTEEAGETETPLQKELGRLANQLTVTVVIISVGLFILGMAQNFSLYMSLVYALGVAMAMVPQALPAQVTVALTTGSNMLADRNAVVKDLPSVETLGSTTVICTDKTGTLTKGVVQLDGALDVEGQPSEAVLQQAYLNAQLQTGLDNPLDQAVVTAAAGVDLSDCAKLDEIPYDFVRKRLSIVIRSAEGAPQMITKGALQNVLEVCDRVQLGGGLERLTEEHHQHIQQRFSAWSEQGYRVLGVAQKALPPAGRYARSDEQEMVFTGFLLFFDPPEEGVRKTLNGLRRLGVQLKIITGDNHLVARHVAEAVGIKVKRIITGAELVDMKDEALWHLAPQVTLFAEVDPNQKERIITALQKSGHVVGYLGDGINDAPALHAADVGVSVDQAVDVAKEAADFVLLEHDLEVLRAGIDEGRHAFANTLKYIFITTSANFGNMVSMALATLYLPFLPLLAKQILLNNLLSDIPAMGIAGDNVDRDWERTPHRWDIRLIRNFMISFGLLSTVFDLLAFGVLLYLAGGVAEVFRTGWFVESLVSELLILFVIRTYKPFYKSRPGRILIISTLGVAILALLLPYLPIGAVFDLVPLPPVVMLAMLVITAGYVLASELAKRAFYRRFG